jgi:hypothetical protein
MGGTTPATIDPWTEEAVSVANTIRGIWIATSSSARRGMVGMGGAIHDSRHCHRQRTNHMLSHSGSKNRTEPIHGGTRSDGNGNEAPTTTSGRKTDHHCYKQLGSPAGMRQPRHQSGQTSIEEIYEVARMLKRWQFYFHGMGPI